MCGICGVLRWESTDGWGPHTVRKLIALMKRRGPDQQGVWSDRKSCTFGFSRLAILDLSHKGNQPMATNDGRYVIVFNGEVYNFKELRLELKKEGRKFRSTGDTEVVLNALHHWGFNALNRFNGMFALAIFDTKKEVLLLARDHAGIKPLYYMLTRRGLVFASQYDQILAHPWSKELSVSEEGLGLYLRLSYIPAPYAMLENTYMLEPGSWMEIKKDRTIEHGRFFQFPVFRQPDLFGRDVYDAVDTAVTNAVKRQLVSDVPLGTFLSGGVDSPLIAAKVRNSSNRSLSAFTIGTNGDKHDESIDAINYARELGIHHIVQHVSSDDCLKMLDDVVESCGEPFGDYSIFPTMIISKLARKNVKVMLSGDGGDELFWGYVSRFGPLIENAKDFRHPYLWRSSRWAIKKFLGLGRGYSNLRQQSLGRWYLGKHSRIGEVLLEHIFTDIPKISQGFSLFQFDGWETDVTAQWLRWNEFFGHLTMILLKVDRASMFNSLEVRVPFLDREVVDIATRVDWRSCLNLAQSQGKIPLRVSLGKHIGHQTQQKRGFTISMDEWLRGPLKPVFEDNVLSRREILGLPINPKGLKSIFDLHLDCRIDFASGLWVLLSLALWQNQHYH